MCGASWLVETHTSLFLYFCECGAFIEEQRPSVASAVLGIGLDYRADFGWFFCLRELGPVYDWAGPYLS